MDSEVKYGQEIGKILIRIGQRLLHNQNLLRLLVNTDKDPLNPNTHPDIIDGMKLMNKNIRFVPLLKLNEVADKDQKSDSKLILFYEDGSVNGTNSDNENLSLVINVYCPFNQWPIAGNDLRPFAIMSEIRQSIQDRRINGLGEIKYLGFSLSSLTEEMGCYSMRFNLNAFS